MFLASKTNNAI